MYACEFTRLLHAAKRMHFKYPGSCSRSFKSHTSFRREILLNISNHLLNELICIIAMIPLIFANSCPGWPIYWTSAFFPHCFSVRSEISLSTDVFLALLLFRASKRYFTVLIQLWSCLNQSSWWLCRRHTRSIPPWPTKFGPNTSN